MDYSGCYNGFRGSADSIASGMTHSAPVVPGTLRTLIVDNYDSYTFNLLQLFEDDQLANVVVIRNDQFEWSNFEQEILPYFDQVILSPGPGRPERSEDFGICTQILQTTHIPIFGVCLGHQGIGHTHGAKVTYGAEPVHGQIATVHHNGTGLFSGIPQDFEAVRYHSLVVDEDSLPDELRSTAWCLSLPLIQRHQTEYVSNGGDDVEMCTQPTFSEPSVAAKSIMGIQHATLPHHGVQFHPESICTKYGKQMMANFFKISQDFYAHRDRSEVLGIPAYIRSYSVVPTSMPSPPSPLYSTQQAPSYEKGRNLTNPYSLLVHALDPALFPDPEVVFSTLFLTGPESKAASWWLDSARQPHPMSRFSFMGGVETRRYNQDGDHLNHQENIVGASQAVIQYSTLHKEINVRRFVGQDSSVSSHKRIRLNTFPGQHVPTSFWDWMSKLMKDFSRESIETTVTGSRGDIRPFDEVPFDFFGGMVGYLGYEMKRESLEGYHTPAEQQCFCQGHSSLDDQTLGHCTCDCERYPDASFVLATQAVVFDHLERRLYVLGLVNNKPDSLPTDIGVPVGFESHATCENWIQDVAKSIHYISHQSHTAAGVRRKSLVTGASPNKIEAHTPYLLKQRHRRQSSAGLLSSFKVDVTEKNYIKSIQDSLDYIHEGESYELCLTTQFRAKIPQYLQQDAQQFQGDPAFDLYKILRKLNPAPFSTFLSMPTAMDARNDNPDGDMVSKLILLSSSPERFLKVGEKPADERQAEEEQEIEKGCANSALGDGLSSRTVEMKPIKGTAAVAKGCFCKEDEGCGVDERDDDSSEHAHDDDDSDLQRNSREGSERRLRSDRCAEARQREDRKRVESLAKNKKERAENLMIVDLIRNDLAHVCNSKSVRVPCLMHVESYETVHQLVTTVRGELFGHVDNTQAVRACFPPGSMTGAPKLRSVQLLDSLEHNVRRGVYSGCLGYIGIPAVASGSVPGHKKKIRTAVDMAVVIRTAVVSVPAAVNAKDRQEPVIADLSVGAGGALTILSDPKEEWREVLLKSRSVVPRCGIEILSQSPKLKRVADYEAQAMTESSSNYKRTVQA
ncbi:Protein phosphatase PP2A regulatory subunit B [Podila humilis]|nr:Protein phosphatase PP2A regulatory subunit B [Podila humilis]